MQVTKYWPNSDRNFPSTRYYITLWGPLIYLSYLE